VYKKLSNICFAVGWVCVVILMLMGCSISDTYPLNATQVTAFLFMTGILLISIIGIVVFQRMAIKSTRNDWESLIGRRNK
jgi:hypothetical protein